MLNNEQPQTKKKHLNRRWISVLFLVVFCFNFFVVGVVKEVKADVVSAPALETIETLNMADRISKWYKDWVANLKKTMTVQSGVIFLLNAADNFAQNMAQKIAVGMATSAKGGKPLMFNLEWGKYLKDASDNAAGTFIEGLGKEWNVDLCQPDLSLQLKFTMGLYNIEQPRKLKCTFSKMRDNWNEAVRSPDFLKNFSASFDSKQSDVGIFMNLAELKDLVKAKQEREAELARNDQSGLKPIVSPISNDIITPVATVKKTQEQLGQEVVDAERKKQAVIAAQLDKLGGANILVRFLKTFGKTLSNQLVTRYFKGEYSLQDASDAITKAREKFCKDNKKLCNEGGGSSNGLSNPNAQAPTNSKATIEAQYAKLVPLDLIDSGNFDVLPELASCPNPQHPGPTTCVIDQNFSEAIMQKMTLQEAINKEKVNGAKAFGSATGDFNGGYPYRSILILRKYRIVPVGWELAAEYINNFSGGKSETLNSLIVAYDDPASPYYHLVDPNWVLKIPSIDCKAKGIGPEIISDTPITGVDSNKDTDFTDPEDTLPSRAVVRNEEYCADEQSCIKENTDGTCAAHGYCMEDKRLWKFSNGEGCDKNNNTCQAFSSADGTAVSYLKNSIDWGGCTADNAGCQGYCNNFNAEENKLTRSGALAFWDMNSLVNNIIVDGSGNKNDATAVNGPTLVDNERDDGKGDMSNGQALKFNGSNYLTTKIIGSQFNGKNISLQLWFKSAQSGVSAALVTTRGIAANNGFTLLLNDGNLIYFTENDADGGSKQVLAQTTSAFNNNLWHQVVAVTDRSAGKNYIYVDGKLEIVSATGLIDYNFSASPTDASLAIGAMFKGTSSLFNGILDDVAIYDRALSANEIWNGYLSYDCNSADNLYLSGKAEDCDADQAGCGAYLSASTSLVGYWQFNEGANTKAFDSTGLQHEGVISPTPANWITDSSHQALSFNNTNSYVSIDDAEDLKLTKDLTIGLWIKPAAIQADLAGVISKFNNSTADYSGFVIEETGSNTNKFVFNWGDGLAWAFNLSSAKTVDLTADVWQYLTIVKNKTKVAYYINGILTQTAEADSAVSEVIAKNGLALLIGSWFDTTPAAHNFNGSLDDVSLWNRALDSGEVGSLYAGGINFSSQNIKVANTNLHCFGRTAGDAIFDLPKDVFGCLNLGARYDSAGEGSCFEFLADKNETDCAKNNGVWLSAPQQIPRYTADGQTACEKFGGSWLSNSCQAQCLKKDDAVCNNYAFNCKASEVGCEKYTPVVGGSSIPGVASADDFCPGECAGYDTYKQEATNFESAEFPVNFIPATSKTCSAVDAGCDEFTNLEATTGGGENLEYYSYLRSCEKVPTVDANYQCGSFYTWVGSDVTGYQLQSYFLKSLASGSAEQPVEILSAEDKLGQCQDANDALTNENCKEFYNSSGVINYHLLKKTVSCSNDCVNYRKTAPANLDLAKICSNVGGSWGSNVLTGDPDQPTCVGNGNAWSISSGQCFAIGCDVQNQQACAAVGGVWFGGQCKPIGQATGTNIADSDLCSGSSYLAGNWDSVNLLCTKTNYKTVAAESSPCSKAMAGCRAYTGNSGNNTMDVFADNFESTSYLYDFPSAGQGWSNGILSSESIVAGQKSLKINDGENQSINKWLLATCSNAATCQNAAGCDCVETATLNDGVDNDEVLCQVGAGQTSCLFADNIYDQGTYLLSFWAKGNSGDEVTVLVSNGTTSEDQIIGKVNLSRQWEFYTVGPLTVKIEPNKNYQLVFAGINSNGGNPASLFSSYFDNVQIKAVSSQIYQIKNSWQTPQSCDQDRDGNPSLYYMLGCDGYTNSSGAISYLKSFTNLCRAEATGCQQFINTHNSSQPFAQTWNAGTASEVTVPEDSITYLARANENSCLAVGCTALGDPVLNQDKTVINNFNQVYKINNPGKYDSTLCLKENVGCSAYTAGDQPYYFKDPADQTCEYIKPEGTTSYAWYKKAAKYEKTSPLCKLSNYQNMGVDYPAGTCVGGNNPGGTCLANWDAYLTKQCQDGNGTCQANGQCTGGTSSVTNCQSQCTQDGGRCSGWTGSCPATDSSCSAFIDPVGDFNVNLVTNNSFSQNVDVGAGNVVPDSWTTSISSPLDNYLASDGFVKASYNPGVTELSKTIDIKPNTVYNLSSQIKNLNNVDAWVDVVCQQTENFTSSPFSPQPTDQPFYLLDAMGELRLEPLVTGKNYRARLVVPATKLTADFQKFSLRFFSGTCTQVKLALGGNGNYQAFTDVGLTEAGVYYYLDNSLTDAKTECKNLVNSERGCVLLNNRNNAKWQTMDYVGNLTLNADKTAVETQPELCQDSSGNKFGCNADTVMKVAPDRDCAKWLSCSSEEIVSDQAAASDNDPNKPAAKTKRYCSSRSVCDTMNEQGLCTHNASEYSADLTTANMTFDNSTIDQIKNLTGYSKVGFNWGNNQKIEGNLPVAQMVKPGTSLGTSIFNGDFEDTDKVNPNMLIKNWSWSNGKKSCAFTGVDCTAGTDTAGDGLVDACENDPDKNGVLDEWAGNNCTPSWNSLLNNSVDEQKEEVARLSGKIALRLPAGSTDAYAVSETFDVGSDTTYSVSGYINTSKLKSTTVNNNIAGVIVIENAVTATPFKILAVGKDRPWTYVQAFFTTNATTNKIRIKLADLGSDTLPFVSCNTSCSGTVYFDNIQIQPVLRLQLNGLVDDMTNLNLVNDIYGSRSCRVFPQSESLACEYSGSDGYQYAGVYGYCLERDPLYPDYCLNWYPVDDVSSSSSDHVGYGFKSTDNYPLYYCLQEKRAKSCIYNDARDAFVDDTGVLAETDVTYCNTITRVVNDNRTNKAWYGRTLSGSSYQVPTLNYTYGKNMSPYGAIDLKYYNNEPSAWPILNYNSNDYAPYSCDTTGAVGDCSPIDADDSSFYDPLNNLNNGTSTTPKPEYQAGYSTDVCSTTNSGTCTATDTDIFKFHFSSDGRSIHSGPLLTRTGGNYSNCFITPIQENNNFGSRLCPLTIQNNYNDNSYDDGWPADDYTLIGPGTCVWQDGGVWKYAAVDQSGNGVPLIFNITCSYTAVSSPNSCTAGLSTTGEAQNRLKELWAESYDSWARVGNSYQLSSLVDWTPPAICSGTPPVRPADALFPQDYCYIPPKVTNLTVNNLSSAIIINSGDATNLSFNSEIDIQQLPMTSYLVKWQDNTTDSGASGVAVSSQPNIPHQFSHQYNYLNLTGISTSTCGTNCFQNAGCNAAAAAVAKTYTQAFCSVTPTVEIKDNWGNTTSVPASTIYVLSNT